MLSLVTFNQFGVNLYLPSMLAMSQEFASNDSAIRLTLTLYFVGFALATLFWATLSDGVGRMAVIRPCLVIFAVASAVIWQSHSLTTILWMRLVQGAGAAGLSSLSRAMLADSFSGKELTVASSHRAILSVSSAISALLLGGYIQSYLAWRVNFLLLTIGSALLGALLMFALRESKPRSERHGLHPVIVLRNYRSLLSSVDFLPFALALAFTYGFGAIYQSLSPFLLLDTLGLSPVVYGWTAAAVCVGYFLGSTLCGRYAYAVGEHRWINRSLELALLFSLILLATGLFHKVELFFILIPVGLTLFAIGLCYPLISAAAIRAKPTISGSASALIGFFCFGGGAVTSWVGAHLPYQTQTPLASVILIELGAVALVLRVWLPRWRRRVSS